MAMRGTLSTALSNHRCPDTAMGAVSDDVVEGGAADMPSPKDLWAPA